MRKVLLWGRGAPLSFLLSALLVGGLRAAGLLQGSEWWAYDRFLRSLPMPTEEPRVTVVGITETDVNTYRYPIDDRTLARALENILASNPRGVGIVLLRDLPVPPGNAKLRALLAKSPPLVGSTFIGGIENESIPPPPTLPEQQVGAVDLIGDGDGVLRRTQLYPGGTPAMGLKLALNYLAAEGIVDRASPNGWLQLGDLEVVPLRPNSGPYSKAQTPGTQIFLPYQGLEKRFTTISLQQAIEGNFDPAIFQGRVVLLGPTAASIDAGFFTPYTRDLTRISPPKMAGVFIHAQVAAGLLEAVLGDRQLLRVFPDPLEYFWIFAIGGIQFGALLFWREAKLQFALPGFALNALALSGATWAIARYAFTVGWWIPVAPPLAIVWICALTGTIGNLISRLLNYQQQLQRHLIEQEQTAVLGELASSLGHEIRGSLNQILQEASVLRFLFEYSIPSLAEVDAASADNALQITELNVQHIDTMLQAILNPNVEGITVLNPLVDEVCTVIAHHFNAREDRQVLRPCLDLDPALDRRPCVPILVAPAIANLVRNGFEALEGADKPQLSVATRLCDRSVEIEVSDNGPGVPAAARAQIFQKLVSSKGDRHRGLGLYLSKQLIEKAGGQIRVTDSAVGGARFLIQLSLPKA